MRRAGPAEILRATQKDDEFIKRLQGDIKDISQRIKGDAWWLRWHRQLDSAATYAYLLLTTVGGLQTLGEEYAGIVQVTGRRRLPGAVRRFLMVTLHTFGPLLVERLIRRWEGPAPARPRLSVIFQLLYQLNITAFYMGSAYYHLDKRATGIKYLLVRPWMGDALSRRTFLLLGVISLLHLCISAAIQLRGIAAPDPGDTPAAPGGPSEDPSSPSEDPEVPHALRCPLCLGRRSVTTATPCGHLFCWACVVDWVQTQPSCPVCREEVQPHRVVPLRAYD